MKVEEEEEEEAEQSCAEGEEEEEEEGKEKTFEKMLDYLKEKRDAGFFKSLSGLMQSCSVLDLNAFERQNKAEGLGMVTEEGSSK
ncbi:hypothetical protein JZ751_002863 [Albula glossodonta]|uniref:Uncharacterized protein n=1 Tax=Albula glossodonta TaxID=121402 RepID=A0A8T2N9B2_9TELE|nr:hypothetical protein JZ751_002863 [Albula glossodonta]